MANNTIFDDVFRTMLEKMPHLVIPLINEVFGTDYPDDIPIVQKRNEHLTATGIIITDSHLFIADKIYHIECQSTSDSTMVIRMIQYDFATALEYAEKENGKYRIYFRSPAYYIYVEKTVLIFLKWNWSCQMDNWSITRCLLSGQNDIPVT